MWFLVSSPKDDDEANKIRLESQEYGDIMLMSYVYCGFERDLLLYWTLLRHVVKAATVFVPSEHCLMYFLVVFY